ncbi:hypothetical protein Ae201684P_003017 [Aphanomyces euteiches]|nr:hypothetical protein Ae201684P_003017 [Aphanomyces euteiches]
MEAAAYRDWSAASVFGPTKKLPKRPLPQSNQELQNELPRPKTPRKLRQDLHEAAALIQKTMHLRLLRQRSLRATQEVDMVMETLRKISVETIQRNYRCHQTCQKQKRRGKLMLWIAQHGQRQQSALQKSRRRRSCAAAQIQRWWRKTMRSVWATIKIQSHIRKYIARKHLLVSKQRRTGAGQIVNWYHQCLRRQAFSRMTEYTRHLQTLLFRKQATRIFWRLQKYVVHQRQLRNSSCLTIQRVFRGMRGRRIANDIRKRRFQCTNCGLIEPGGIYCKRCGRPKGTVRRKTMPQLPTSPRLELGPVTTTRMVPIPPPRRRDSDKSIKLVDETRRRALVIDGSSDCRGDKALRMMTHRLHQSGKFRNGSS